jgi:hypothetical protein
VDGLDRSAHLVGDLAQHPTFVAQLSRSRCSLLARARAAFSRLVIGCSRRYKGIVTSAAAPLLGEQAVSRS